MRGRPPDRRVRGRRRAPAIVRLLRRHVDLGIVIAVDVHRLIVRRIVAALAKVLRLDVADVQKAVAADAEIDERRLDARLQIDDPALIDVADVVVLAGPLDIELFEQSILNDRDPAFLRLRDIDQHFFFHVAGYLLGFGNRESRRINGVRRGQRGSRQ